MSKQLNEVAYVYEIVHFYSNGADSTKQAMEEITKQRKALSAEKKELGRIFKHINPLRQFMRK